MLGHGAKKGRLVSFIQTAWTMQTPTFKDYAHFLTEDFLQDAYFQHWVKSGDEAANTFWQGFLLSYPHQQEHIREAREILEQIRYQPHSLSRQRQDAMLAEVYAGGDSRKRGHVFFHKKHMAAAAASISLLIASFLFWLFYPSYETYATAFQETRTVQLADGSEVTLNANTTIRVAIDKDKNQPRRVWLEGEAYFHVRPLDDAKAGEFPELRKFIVYTDNFDIEVLGTIFNASSRERKSEVYLEEGKVKVASDKIARSQILEPGDQLALSEEDEVFRVKKVARAVAPAWQDNYFIFKSTPLEEVAREIENYYGLEVELADPALADKIFTAKVSREHLPMLLQAIEASFGVKTTKEDNRISIQP